MPSKASKPRKPAVVRHSMKRKIARAIEAKSSLPMKIRRHSPQGAKPTKR